ncbi:MAG: hypothetical protein ACYS8Z_01240 [Planctomycetota bacterium]|jgi:hypothetical protein
MKSRENKQLEKFLKGSDLKTSPQKDQQVLERALASYRRNEQNVNPVSLWRLIMKSPITRVAAILILTAGLAVMGWHSLLIESKEPTTLLSLISSACAAEQTLFTGEGIIHITHEITLYPNSDSPDMAAKLEELLKSDFSSSKNADFVRAWASSHVWLPVHSLDPDGQFGWHKLELVKTAEKANLVHEHIWYDPDSGFFARVFKQAGQVLFATSFDGQAVYLAKPSETGRFEIKREPITEQFSLPKNPAEFLGISASFQGAMDIRNLPPVEKQTSETLPDGTPLRVYKLRWEDTDAYHVFKVHDEDDTIEQIESVAYGTTIQQIQRISSDLAETAGVSWNLAELAGQTTPAQSEVTFTEGMTEITAQQMADRALIETYVLGRTPDWIAEQTFIEVLDDASPVRRMFMVFCQAKDGRHVAITQGSTLGMYLEAALGMIKKAGFQWTPRVFASNRFKLHALPDFRYLPDIGFEGMSNFSPGQVFKDMGFEPSEQARAYLMQSPTNANFAMSVNGVLSNQELEDLIGGLMPAKLYSESGQAIDWYMDMNPNCVTYKEFEPGAFMKEWLVLGSFRIFEEGLSFNEKFRDNETQQRALDKDQFDIHKFQPVVNIGGREYHWQLYCSPSEIVEMSYPLGMQNFANAYALAQIEMTEDTPVVLAIGDDDAIKVWLNGELVHEDRVGGHLVPDKALVPVTLRKGVNRLLMKIQNGITEWQFTFRIFEAGYNPQVDEMKPELSSVTYDGLKPGKFMKKWLLLGRIPACDGEPNWADSKAGFDRQDLPSLEKFQPTVRIGDEKYAWKPYQSYTGILDIHRAWPQGPVDDFSKDHYIYAYAWAQVDMPEETPALLGIGYDDAAKVWLNGELVHDNWTRGPAFPDHRRVEVTFRKGLNQLVVKIQNREGRWKFCCRLLE